MKRIVIIGSGIGGLATANLLARDGYDVHVYEKNDQLGGRSGQFKKMALHLIQVHHGI